MYDETMSRYNHFLCFYDSCYISLTVHPDENLSNQCQLDLVYPYSKPNKVERFALGNLSEVEMVKKGLLASDLLKEVDSSQIEATYFLKTQIKCLQNINVLGYRLN